MTHKHTIQDFKKIKFNRHQLLILALFVFGCFIRVYQLGVIPGGVNQDEAFAGYNAWSLLKFGMDSEGYRNPVYFIAWGSGMNALNSYLMIPFIMLFGLKTWVIRLPQVILACVSLWVFYRLLGKLYHEKVATIGLFLICINPWHFMLSRWGLESNLAPGFLLLGLYFFVCGYEDNKYLLWSALFYGLSLYCYATVWVIVPFIVLFQALYGFYTGKIKWNKYILWSIIILGILAFPLLLFIAVNMGIMPEIRTPIMSIPGMTGFRSGELNILEIRQHLIDFLQLMWKQNDGALWNCVEDYGIFYLFSTPIILYGLYSEAKAALSSCGKREFNSHSILFLTFIPTFVLVLMLDYTNINKVNSIWLPLLIFNAVGLYKLGEDLHQNLRGMLVLMYACCFLCFMGEYTGSYAKQMEITFQKEVDTALNYAQEVQNGKTIYVDSRISYSKILYYTEYSPLDFIHQRVFAETEDGPGMRQIVSIGDYTFGYDLNNLDDNGVYIYDNVDLNTFKDLGFEVRTTDHYSIAYK